MKNSLVDPYDNNFYQAKLIKENKKIYFNPDKDLVLSRIQIHLSISLVNNGVNVSYNPDIIKFVSKDREIQFRREINAFFIRNGFILDAIHKEILVYNCGTRVESGEFNMENDEFIFNTVGNFIDDDLQSELNKIISFVILESVLNS